MSRVRQNFHDNCEALINKQINTELYASYVYMTMAAFFTRETQALHGFAEFFRKRSEEEREHAWNLVKYQHMRGGRSVFQDISRPTKLEWNSALEAVEGALELEKTVNQSLLELHREADNQNDSQMCDFLEGDYLKEQVEDIKELSDLVTKLKRAGDGLGVHIIDKELS